MSVDLERLETLRVAAWETGRSANVILQVTRPRATYYSALDDDVPAHLLRNGRVQRPADAGVAVAVAHALSTLVLLRIATTARVQDVEGLRQGGGDVLGDLDSAAGDERRDGSHGDGDPAHFHGHSRFHGAFTQRS